MTQPAGIMPDRLFQLLAHLKCAKIDHRLRNTRDDAILSVDVSVPGERWEIDFLHSGEVDVEVFTSDGTVFGESKLDDLFARFSD